MSLPWAPEWRLWSLSHLSGEASGQSPIRPQSPRGAGTTANTPPRRVRSFGKAALLALPFQVFGGLCGLSPGALPQIEFSFQKTHPTARGWHRTTYLQVPQPASFRGGVRAENRGRLPPSELPRRPGEFTILAVHLNPNRHLNLNRPAIPGFPQQVLWVETFL